MNVFIFVSVFLGEAQSSTYKIMGHDTDMNREDLTKALSTFLEHAQNNDCSSLKDHTSGAAKTTVKKVQDIVQKVGPEISKDNPMFLPVIMMASGWITSTSHNMIDSMVENQLCQVVVEGFGDGVKQNLFNHLGEVIKSLGHKDQCQALQQSVRNARETFKQHMSSHLTSFAGEMGTALNFPAAGAMGMMAQSWITSSLDSYTDPLIANGLCNFVYPEDEL